MALITSAVIWGITTVILKDILNYIPPFSLAFLRFSLASLVISPILLYNETRHPIQSKDLPKLFFFGLIGITLHLSLVFLGVKYTTATNAAVITSLSPLTVAAAAAFFLREKINRNYYLGSLVALSGTTLIFAEPLLNNENFSSEHLLGNFLILASVFVWAVFNISSKEMFKKYHPFTVTAVLFLTGMVTFAPLAFLEYQSNPTWPTYLSLKILLELLFLVLFSSVLAYLLYEWGLKYVKASTAGLTNYLLPVTTVTAAVIFLGETLTLFFTFGSILIILGLIITNHHSSHHRHSHKT